MQFTHSPYFIAEIGVNHNGSFDKAIRLIESASACGANAVKFQSFKACDVVIDSAPKANYQLETNHQALSPLRLVCPACQITP